jgi:hypothetical protein
MIDDWLHTHNIQHVYEQKLPIRENAICDFYLPQHKVYIEYWGLEDNPNYAQRKREKEEIYKRHSMQLISVTDAEIKNLEDSMVRLLLPFGFKFT